MPTPLPLRTEARTDQKERPPRPVRGRTDPRADTDLTFLATAQASGNPTLPSIKGTWRCVGTGRAAHAVRARRYPVCLPSTLCVYPHPVCLPPTLCVYPLPCVSTPYPVCLPPTPCVYPLGVPCTRCTHSDTLCCPVIPPQLIVMPSGGKHQCPSPHPEHVYPAISLPQSLNSQSYPWYP